MSGLVRRFLTLPLLAALVGIGLVVAPTAAPAYAASTPTGLKAVAVSSNAVALTWNRVSGADAYRVQFSKSSSMKSFKTVDVDTNYVEWTYLNPEPSANSGRLKANTTYYFRVKVITKVDLNHSAKSLSKYGAKLKVKTSGTGSRTYLAPMKLKATDRSATSEYVSWNSRGPGIHYRVRYTTGGNTQTKVFDYAGGVLTGLTTGATYSYSVEVISRDNDTTLSPASAPLTFTPAATAHPAIKIASYNICGNACGNWGGREPGMLDSLHRQAPDLIATQESTNSDDLINDYNDLRQPQLRAHPQQQARGPRLSTPPGSASSTAASTPGTPTVPRTRSGRSSPTGTTATGSSSSSPCTSRTAAVATASARAKRQNSSG